jgi:hypothetical protein
MKVNAVEIQLSLVGMRGELRCGGGGGKVDPPTSSGSQFDQSAQERIIIKNPTARTKESKMTAGEMLEYSLIRE